MSEPIRVPETQPEYQAARARIAETTVPPAIQTLNAIRDRAKALYLAWSEFLAGKEIEDGEINRVRSAQRDALDMLHECDEILAARARKGESA